jgi:hypothetical protein
MAAHPLHRLGFEPVGSPARSDARSLAELGFEPTATHVVSARAEAAARRTARERRLLPQMQQLIVRPQVAGSIEPGSGRKIVQPTDNPAINQALATDAMPAYKSRLEEVLRDIPGATLAATRDAKKPARLAEKISGQGQPAETVSDYGAAQVAVDSPRAKDAVLAAVKQHFPVLRQQDNFAFGDPEYRYRSYSLQVQMPNGASEELQIVPREVFEANRQEHHDYKEARNAELAGKSAGQVRAAARAINDAAMERFNSRNGVSSAGSSGLENTWADRVVKGSRVRLTDGTPARVVYVDPNMRIARVRTEDGRNVTVRRKDLRRPDRARPQRRAEGEPLQ